MHMKKNWSSGIDGTALVFIIFIFLFLGRLGISKNAIWSQWATLKSICTKRQQATRVKSWEQMHQSLVAYNAGMLLASLMMMMRLVWHVHMLIALLKPDSQYDAGTAGVMSVMGKVF